MAYAQLTPEEVKNGYAPQVVFVDEENKIVRTTTYEKHGLLKEYGVMKKENPGGFSFFIGAEFG